MNRLQYETSPYLLQHKNNPVDWYPWGDIAFQKAKEEDKPILLSIGYATCHWCHVMEKETFEDASIAQVMNELFVCIKLDREEYPAVDQYYMDAIQVFSGGGGWPLNCFLTPELKPYFLGTYYPPKPVYKRPAWKTVLLNMADAFQTKRDEVEKQAERLHSLVQSSSEKFVQPSQTEEWPQIIDDILRSADWEYGGQEGAPKFPTPHLFHYLLHVYNDKEGHATLLKHLHQTAKAFCSKGLFDPVHGGFARYAVDKEWKVPHFEKMLYDNAGIISFLAILNKVHQRPIYKWAIQKSLGFLKNWMQNEKGLFFSAIDADSEGQEGKFYTWTYEELETVLLQDEIELLQNCFDINKNGNWEGTNILYQKAASEFSTEELLSIDPVLNKLKKASENRIPPSVDTKILLDWNAMMLTHLIWVDRYTNFDLRDDITYSAKRLNALFIEDGKICGHAYRNGKFSGDVILDDYAHYIQFLIEYYSIDFDFNNLVRAKSMLEKAIDLFSDDAGCYFYKGDHQKSILKSKNLDIIDAAYPSSNALMAINLWRLGKIFDQGEWLDRASQMLAGLKDSLSKYPTSFSVWSTLLELMDNNDKEVVIAGSDKKAKAQELYSKFMPYTTILINMPEVDLPIFRAKSKSTKYYLCENYSCQIPVDNMKDFINLKPSKMIL